MEAIVTATEVEQYRIREFRPEDAEALSDLILETIETTIRDDYTDEQITELKAYFSPEKLRQYQSMREMYVAESAGNLLGTVSVDRHGDYPDSDILLSLFVEPRYQKQGVGRSLVEHTESRARARGARHMRVGSSLTAYGFYRRVGYGDMGERTEGAEISIEMRKTLIGGTEADSSR